MHTHTQKHTHTHRHTHRHTELVDLLGRLRGAGSCVQRRQTWAGTRGPQPDKTITGGTGYWTVRHGVCRASVNSERSLQQPNNWGNRILGSRVEFM